MSKVIGIIGGKGAMGKYFAEFFKENGFEVLISDKGTKLSNIQLAKKADVVVVSVPIGVTEKVIRQIAPHVKKDGLLMDFTSLKVFPMEAMKACRSSYLGCHPLFGPTTSIEGQMVILCKGKGDKWFKWWRDLLLENKVELRELTAKKHDKLMAYIQALTHFSYLGLADVLKESGLKLSGLLEYESPVYRLRLDFMGRILNQDPNLYAQIQIQNPDSIKVMEDLLASSCEWTELVEKKDLKGFEKKFNELSKYFGRFTKKASEESDFLIEQMNRKKLMESNKLESKKPDKSYDLVALGPENTFSSLAAKKFSKKISRSQVSSLAYRQAGLKSQGKIWYADSISEVFELVKKGVIKQGIVPVENKLTGTVAETSDNLFESGLKIQEELSLPIHHCLSVISKASRKDIRTIYSHIQPLRQCKKYIKRHYPKAELVAMPSTAAALKKVASENEYNAGAICSEEAAKDFRMKVLAKNIEDYKHNSTRFLIIGKQESPVRKGRKYKTSIAFYFSADAPGTLHQVLGEFAQAGVNMTRIESSANLEIPGGYVFYADFEGHTKEAKIQNMLSKIRKLTKRCVVLGSFPF